MGVLRMSLTMCPACLEAAQRVSHSFNDCAGCRARAVARDPRFHEARKAGKLTPLYRRMLEQAQLTHDQVKAAHAADAMSRGKR